MSNGTLYESSELVKKNTTFAIEDFQFNNTERYLILP